MNRWIEITVETFFVKEEIKKHVKNVKKKMNYESVHIDQSQTKSLKCYTVRKCRTSFLFFVVNKKFFFKIFQILFYNKPER